MLCAGYVTLPCFSQAHLRMLSVHSDWFGKQWIRFTRQSETLADCKEIFVPSEPTAAVNWCFQSTGSICHQPALVTVHLLSMAGDLVEGGHRGRSTWHHCNGSGQLLAGSQSSGGQGRALVSICLISWTLWWEHLSCCCSERGLRLLTWWL